jgi:hypothetical protein
MWVVSMGVMTDTKDVMNDSGGKENGITLRAGFLVTGIISLGEIEERMKLEVVIPHQAGLERVDRRNGLILDKASTTLTSVILALEKQIVAIYKERAMDRTFKALGYHLTHNLRV